MAAGEGERFELLNSLIEALGEDVAHKLMDSLPPFSWDQVATKDDLNALSLVHQAGLKLTPHRRGMSSPQCSSWEEAGRRAG